MTSALLNADALPTPIALPAPDVLHELYNPRITRFLLASTRDRDLAETLAQETFLRAWQARDQFRGEASILTWLTRIALNLLRDHTRTNYFRFWRRARNSAVDAAALSSHLPSTAAATDSALIAHQQLTLIWQTVETLSDRQRIIFLLRFVEEFELNEIASALQIPLPTVKTHLYRALAIVRTRHAGATTRTSR